MPDLFGLSLLVGGLYFFLLSIRNSTKRNLIFLGLFIGLLSGVRLSYFPFFVPVIYLLYSCKNVKYFILSTFFFILIWLIPWIFITDVSELIKVAINDVQGHFFRWGGTIYSEKSSLFHRFFKIIESVFADSLGTWWIGRHWITILNSIFILLFLFLSFFKIYLETKSIKKEFLLLALCFSCYFFWVFLFQNIVYKPRHLMPFIPLMCCFLGIGFHYLYDKINNKLYQYLLFFSILPYLLITGKLVYQHMNHSSISQISQYISTHQIGKKIVISQHLMNYYFHKTIEEDVIYLNDNSYHNKLQYYYNKDFRIFSTVYLGIQDYSLVNKITFYHNPYVNKLWSNVTLYEYERKK